MKKATGVTRRGPYIWIMVSPGQPAVFHVQDWKPSLLKHPDLWHVIHLARATGSLLLEVRSSSIVAIAVWGNQRPRTLRDKTVLEHLSQMFQHNLISEHRMAGSIEVVKELQSTSKEVAVIRQ